MHTKVVICNCCIQKLSKLWHNLGIFFTYLLLQFCYDTTRVLWNIFHIFYYLALLLLNNVIINLHVKYLHSSSSKCFHILLPQNLKLTDDVSDLKDFKSGSDGIMIQRKIHYFPFSLSFHLRIQSVQIS